MMRSSLPASQTFPSTAFQNGSIVGLSDDTAQPFHVLSTTASSLYASLLQAIDGVITFRIPFTKTKTFGQRPFLSRAPHSGTRYRIMFVTQHQHLLSNKP